MIRESTRTGFGVGTRTDVLTRLTGPDLLHFFQDGQTKLSNLLLSNHLASILPPNILSNACEPGFVATELTRNVRGISWLGPLGRWIIKGIAGTAEDGARPQLYLASSTVAKGEYWGPNKKTWEAEKQVPSKFASDEGLQKRCWEWCLRTLEEKGHGVAVELKELGISA
jgi:NAD(P)-dependent dehydrogenase (short-subunit alcohol dehydrogenase family)